jgi:hypothetical protein
MIGNYIAFISSIFSPNQNPIGTAATIANGSHTNKGRSGVLTNTLFLGVAP